MNEAAIINRLIRGPAKFSEIAGPSRKNAGRKPIRLIVDRLIAEGAIRFQYFGPNRYLVMADYVMDSAWLQHLIEENAVQQGGCLEWKGYISRVHGPMGRFNDTVTRPLRRLIYETANGLLTQGKVVKCSCGNDACVAKAHLFVQSRVQATIGKPRPIHARKRMAESSRISHGKLDMETVREMRASDETAEQMKNRLGVSMATVTSALRHRTYKEYSPLFAGLGAR